MNQIRIKERLHRLNIPYWEIADSLGISENTLCRWLRKPLDEAREQSINQAIDELTRGGK